MSLLKVPMPQSIDIVTDIKSAFNGRYKSFLEARYDIDNIDTERWYSSLLDFMLHPYEERIDYHNIRENHICSSWSDEEKAINFLIINIVLHMGTNLNRFDYYFQTKTSFISTSKMSSIENETSKGKSYNVNEIAPINSEIGDINTPNAKSNNTAETNKDRSYTNFDDIKKFIDFNSYTEYENECHKIIDNLVFENNVIY